MTGHETQWGRMYDIPVSGRSIHASVTENCVILTVIELVDEVAGIDIDVKEHDSVVDALAYIKNGPGISSGDFTRVHLLNVSELKGK